MAYYIAPYVDPYSSSYISTVSATTPLSPISSISTITPVINDIKVTPYSTTVTSTNLLYPVFAPYNATIDFETGLNDSYMIQKEATEWLRYRILDKWLYADEMCSVLKYLKVENGVAKPVSSKEAYKENKLCDDKVEDVEAKIKYIEDYILGISEMRKVLQRIINELGYKWTELTVRENIVVEATERYLRKKLKEKIEEKQ